MLRTKRKIIYKMFNSFVALSFIVSMCTIPHNVYAQTPLNLPAPGTMIAPSSGYTPITVSGITIYPENPLQFDFIIDSGDDNYQGEELARESKKLINYFLATLTVPEDEMWVNLSPYEKDRIVADGLGVTEMGRDMLAQDYILKQLTASLMYPEEGVGSEFWKRVYTKTQAKFGTTDIPTNTFNKIWVVPDKATVYIHGNSVFVSESHLKVMLEEDYLAMESNMDSTKHGLGEITKDELDVISDEAKEAIRDILIPEIEREVNEGKNFANLRQMFNSIILATWYKENLKESVLGEVYVNGNKTIGIELENKNIKNEIYNQYVAAFKKGVYNYIKEDYDAVTQEVIPRKYFSGGKDFTAVEVEGEQTDDARRPVEERFADAGAEYTERVELGMVDESGSGVVAEQSSSSDSAMLAYEDIKARQDSLTMKEAQIAIALLGNDEWVERNIPEAERDEYVHFDLIGKFRKTIVDYVSGALVKAQERNPTVISTQNEVRDGRTTQEYGFVFDAGPNQTLSPVFGQYGPRIMVLEDGIYFGKQESNFARHISSTGVLRITSEGELTREIEGVTSILEKELQEIVGKSSWQELSEQIPFGDHGDKFTKEEAENYARSDRFKTARVYTPGQNLPITWEVALERFQDGKSDIFSLDNSPWGEVFVFVEDTDKASLTHGGIDFNPNMLTLDAQGKSINITMDNSMLQSIQPNAVQGMIPVIINITPITNFMPLLGMVDSDKEQQLSQL